MADPTMPGNEITPVTVACLTDAAELEPWERAWDALVERSPGAHLFQSYPWVSSWLRHQPDGRPRLFIARRGERLTAAMPLCAHEAGWGPLRLRTLRVAVDNADFCDGLSDPEHPEDLDRLWQALLSRRDWHLLDLHYLRPDSHLARVAGGKVGRLLADRRMQDTSPYLDITTDWRESVSKGQRSDWLRRRRRLEEQGKLTLERAETTTAIDVLLEQFAELHAARWQTKGETSTYRFAEFRAFVRDVCHGSLRRGHLYLYRLALDGNTVSLGLYFLFRRHLLPYAYTFSAEYARFCPVHLLTMAVVEEMRARNLADLYDFGRGDEEYKLRWTQQSLTLDRILLARRSPLGGGGLPVGTRYQAVGVAPLSAARRRSRGASATARWLTEEKRSMKISIVTCTRNRSQHIERLVHSVLANTHPDWEHLIVDQSTDDLTRRAVAQAAGGDRRVRYLHRREPGKSKAMNAGIRDSDGPVVALLDDDCAARADWLAALARLFSDEAVDIVCGKVVGAPHDPTKGYLAGIDPGPTKVIRGGWRSIRKLGMGANMAMRRAVIEQVGYFDEMVGPGGRDSFR